LENITRAVARIGDFLVRTKPSPEQSAG